MSVDKIWVSHFNILEDENGKIGLEIPLEDEPFRFASFLYDGRNCAVLIRNDTKAYILTNIAYELRPKLLNANPLRVFEMHEQDVAEAYTLPVTKIEALPYEDKMDEVLQEILLDIKEKYGENSLPMLMEKLFPDNKGDGDGGK